jgi:hypothetical protein
VHENPEPRTTDGDPGEDYEYDLAHGATAAAPPAAQEERKRVYVATETDDQGGDYGYDLAHDVPRR